MYFPSTFKSFSLPFFLVFVGLLVVGCDSSGSNSEDSETTTYEFEGLWKHEGGGSWGGGGYEHYLDVSGTDVTKHQVTLDVDGNRVGCDTDTQTIENYDKSSNMVTLDGELHSDGPEIEINVESGTLTYLPEGDDMDEYEKVDELPQGAAERCG